MKKNRRNSKLLIVWLSLVLFVLLLILVLLISPKKESNNSSESSDRNMNSEQHEETHQVNPEILYQSDKIEIYSFFPSSVINTDANSEFIDNLASLEFKNISGMFLKKCEIKISTSEGENYTFLAKDIPAEMKVIAFDVSSKTMKENIDIAEVDCSVETDTSDVLLSGQIEILENGTEVTIKNISQKDLSDLVVTCHCMMDDVGYGGSKYEYRVEMLKAGETATIDATDCYFGQARVVRVSAN